jgi:response regulator NasT
MAERGRTAAVAFRWIQRTAMNERTSMKALAQVILATEVADETTPAGGPTGS